MAKEFSERYPPNIQDMNNTPITPLETLKKTRPSFLYSELQVDVEDGAPDKIKGEILRYLKDDVEPDGTNILLYWKNQKSKYPVLSKMARCFLCIPATSAASERVFSKGHHIIAC
ncbi:uncharacterized protein VP01_2062g2 [Puccinia sorghi]|uniref:HAT C-terminal dimerisation domain-containing protein n=1 Tax=Puccinia sorghi TaxID=27349 RepID=A0A0L6VAQ0_9BASI|nr:uncharacterized protein VP01_2062g2 [Puccinia sorghi]